MVDEKGKYGCSRGTPDHHDEESCDRSMSPTGGGEPSTAQAPDPGAGSSASREDLLAVGSSSSSASLYAPRSCATLPPTLSPSHAAGIL